MGSKIRIGIVGPCSAGKSTLIAGLKQYDYQVKHIAQEHSYVPDMWQRLTNPDILIYLDVSFPMSMQRRKLNWTIEDYIEQVNRLQHARRHANFYLHTDSCSIQKVLQEVLEYLKTVDPSSQNG